MALSTKDQALIADMKQRELHVKKRQRAANAIAYEARRHRGVLLTSAGVVGAIVMAAICLAVERPGEPWSAGWRAMVLGAVVGAALGALVGQGALRSAPGRRLLAAHDTKLLWKYSGDLHAGRRWQEFSYRGEDISAYVPQILYFIESEHRFDSVDAALTFVKKHSSPPELGARALEMFNRVAAQTNALVVSSVDETGRPCGRIVRFVRTDRPGVWYVTTAPDAPAVREFDRSAIAVLTPTQTGSTICSSRVRVRRSDRSFTEVADLYRAQVPGYVDGMTEDEQQRELVWELTLQSATVDTWLEHESVVFLPPDTAAAMVG